MEHTNPAKEVQATKQAAENAERDLRQHISALPPAGKMAAQRGFEQNGRRINGMVLHDLKLIAEHSHPEKQLEAWTKVLQCVETFRELLDATIAPKEKRE